MTNHYLKALALLAEMIPDAKRLIEDHTASRQGFKPKERGTPKKAREFAATVVTDLIEQLEEVREEIKNLPLKRF